MVSRSGLQSQPTAIRHPTTHPVDAGVRQQAIESARQADRQVDQARQAVQKAASPAAVRSAVQDAEKALHAARRAGGDRAAKAALRSLEHRVEQLRREASDKQNDIVGREQQERLQREQMAAIARDHLSPTGLGVPPQVVHAEAGQKGAWNPLLNEVPPNVAVVVDSRVVYETDDLGRTVRAQTVLDQVAVSSGRNPSQQAAAGGADRLSTDDGGHIFATMFGGLGEGVNIHAMDLSINRGAYRQLEELWRRQVESGGQVHVEANFHFEGEDRRSSQFEVTFDFGDGNPVTIPFYQ